MKKEWFMLFRYPVPADMEYYLEEQASLGYYLEPIGEKGLFYYEFSEAKSGKCKYMVDISKLPKSMYMETLIREGWQYMGTSGNCYIWKQQYTDERPKDMSDRLCKLNHCKIWAVIMLLLSILFLGVIIGFAYSFYYEIKMNVMEKHYIYIIEAIINIPFFIVFASMLKKLWNGISIYK